MIGIMLGGPISVFVGIIIGIKYGAGYGLAVWFFGTIILAVLIESLSFRLRRTD